MQPSPFSKPLLLIDGSSYLYRAFHALPPLTNSHGEPTGAVYGVLNMINKLLAEYDPTYIAVIFDPVGQTTRDAIYPAYKAHRPPMPDALRVQVTPVFAAIRAMGLPLIQVDGIEADDVIATFAIQAEKQHCKTVISTGDKDMAQLVNAHITLINTMTNTYLDPAGVVKKFGVPPEKIIDYLALMGDTSDNIPGVPKVGPKTAVKWLQSYGSLDDIIAKASEFTGKIGENLRASIPHLPLSKQLVTLDCQVPLPCLFTDLTKKPADEAALIALYTRLEFKSGLKNLLEKKAAAAPVQEQVTITPAEFEGWLEKLALQETLAFNLATAADAVIGISFAAEKNLSAYLPLTTENDFKKFKPLLEDPQKILIGHNLKREMGLLADYGIALHIPPAHDIMLESYLLDSASNRHDLESLALKYLGKRVEDVADSAGIILQLHHTLWPKIALDAGLKHVLLDIELPLVPVLSRMERHGVCIDTQLLGAQSKELAHRLKVLETQAHTLAGEVFNLASPKQLQAILYTQLKLPVLAKTPTGAASTAESVLQTLALEYPLPKIILEHRSLSKLKSTYTDSLPKQVNPSTGRIHTSYNQAVTATGRLSSTQPNLQNIPIRHDEGRRIRRAFIAPLGMQIVSADYSQIELRIMAHLSQDPNLLAAFSANLDVHTATAAEVFNVPLQEVSAEQRRHAKAINFGLIYGMSAFGLSKQLGIPRDAAQAYIDQYFLRYPGVQAYMEETRALACRQGYVTTLLGRRLSVPDIHSSQLQKRRAAERAAINAPLQGTAADMIKLAMIAMDAWLQKTAVEANMIMQVHDELVFEVAEKAVAQLIPVIREKMTHVMTLCVPLEVQVSVGNNWDEAHE